jgi:hypothetical protein
MSPAALVNKAIAEIHGGVVDNLCLLVGNQIFVAAVLGYEVAGHGTAS